MKHREIAQESRSFEKLPNTERKDSEYSEKDPYVTPKQTPKATKHIKNKLQVTNTGRKRQKFETQKERPFTSMPKKQKESSKSYRNTSPKVTKNRKPKTT
jgi:hypothetical protein